MCSLRLSYETHNTRKRNSNKQDNHEAQTTNWRTRSANLTGGGTHRGRKVRLTASIAAQVKSTPSPSGRHHPPDHLTLYHLSSFAFPPFSSSVLPRPLSLSLSFYHLILLMTHTSPSAQTKCVQIDSSAAVAAKTRKERSSRSRQQSLQVNIKINQVLSVVGFREYTTNTQMNASHTSLNYHRQSVFVSYFDYPSLLKHTCVTPWRSSTGSGSRGRCGLPGCICSMSWGRCWSLRGLHHGCRSHHRGFLRGFLHETTGRLGIRGSCGRSRRSCSRRGRRHHHQQAHSGTRGRSGPPGRT